MGTDYIESKRQGFSETYWNLHRNSLLFSLAWTAACLPGVCLSQTQTWAFVSGHFWQPLLQFVLCLGALYSFAAFFLEWRHEALGQFRIETGRSADLPAQIESLISQIGLEIESAETARSRLSVAITRLEMSIGDYVSIQPQDDNTLRPIIQNVQRDIVALISKEYPVVQEYQRGNPLPMSGMLEHAQISAPLHHTLAKLAKGAYQAAKVGSPGFAPELAPALTSIKTVIEQEGRIAQQLVSFEKRWADLQNALLRQNALATLRTWAVGMGAPILLLLTALSHGFGAWGLHILPIPPLSQLLGHPAACPRQS